MTHQDQIIIICILAIISVPLGTVITIKTINKLTRPPVNTLVRSGDIELVHYIEPTRPQQILNYPDLLESHDRIPYHTSYIERISDYGRLPSYWSGTPPSYQTVDRSYINSSLENAINLDFILIIFVCFLILILILLFLKTYFKKDERIVFTKGISCTEITFIQDYQELLSCRLGEDPSYNILYKNTYYHVLNPYWTLFDIIDWLKLLEEQDYASRFTLVSKRSDDLFSNYPRIILSNEFMVNNNSDPVIISTLLSTELENLYDMFDAEYNENHYIIIQYTLLTASR